MYKKDFPIFSNNPSLIYLDSSATSLKPQQVIDKEFEYYREYSANIFRGLYKISEKATQEYESVRGKVAELIGVKDNREIVFVRNATEAVNLVAATVGEVRIKAGSEIVITHMEHHANIVPWQILAQRKNAELKLVRLTPDGQIDIEQLISLVTKNTKILAFSHVSNVLGTISPVKKIVQLVKSRNPKCIILIDGAQAVPHLPVNVSELRCDFYVFSAHKMLGPTGVGVLWGKYELLHTMQPYQYGGEMIEAVYPDHATFKDAPHKFEAGTPNIAGVIGFSAAIDYLQRVGMDKIREHEIEITEYALTSFSVLNGLKIYGPLDVKSRGGVIAFTLAGVHPHDIAQILDSRNICVRSGHHCAMPLHLYLDCNATARVSFYIYNTKADVDALVDGLKYIQKKFS